MYRDMGTLWAVVVRMVPWKEKDTKIILKGGQYLERRKGNVFRLTGETITKGLDRRWTGLMEEYLSRVNPIVFMMVCASESLVELFNMQVLGFYPQKLRIRSGIGLRQLHFSRQ